MIIYTRAFLRVCIRQWICVCWRMHVSFVKVDLHHRIASLYCSALRLLFALLHFLKRLGLYTIGAVLVADAIECTTKFGIKNWPIAIQAAHIFCIIFVCFFFSSSSSFFFVSMKQFIKIWICRPICVVQNNHFYQSAVVECGMFFFLFPFFSLLEKCTNFRSHFG